MINLNNMQRKINGLLSVFTKLMKALEDNIAELKAGIKENEEEICNLTKQNEEYSDKIVEYETLAKNVKGFINPAGGAEV